MKREQETSIYVLPEHFNPGTSDAIQLFDYRSTQNSFNNYVRLQQNVFSFLLEGTKEVITGLDRIQIQNSDFLLMKSGHCLMTEHLSSRANNYRSLLLFFPNSAVLNFLRKQEITLVAPSLTMQSVRKIPYDPFLQTFVQSLTKLSFLNDESSRKLLQLKFEELMLYLLETQQEDFLSFLLKATDQQANNFIQVVEKNKLNRLSLKELAFLCNMSVSTFKRTFEKHFAQPPIRWFQDQRLEHSAYLLKSEFKRPSDIYEEIGYESLSNFIYAFKGKFGLTPKQFQQHN
jgi:AraC-like DNA-binding protein